MTAAHPAFDQAHALGADLRSPAEKTHIAIEMLGVDHWRVQNSATTVAAHHEAHRAIGRTVQAAVHRQLRWLTFVTPAHQMRETGHGTWFDEEIVKQTLPRLAAAFSRIWVSFNDEAPRAIDTKNPSPTQPKLDVLFALRHDGRRQIRNAVQALAHNVRLGQLSVSDVTADALNSRLNPVGFPDPDLVIRLGCGDPAGDGCLLWQTAYSEFMFVSKSWPDFSEHDLDAAMDHFIQRERRFGGIRP